MNTYAIPVDLLQAVVNNLNGQPAHATRLLLNEIERECAKQDRQASDDAALEQRNAMRAELRSELASQVQAPAREVSAAASPLPFLHPLNT